MRLVFTINRFFHIRKEVFMNLYKYKGKRIRASCHLHTMNFFFLLSAINLASYGFSLPQEAFLTYLFTERVSYSLWNNLNLSISFSYNLFFSVFCFSLPNSSLPFMGSDLSRVFFHSGVSLCQ